MKAKNLLIIFVILLTSILSAKDTAQEYFIEAQKYFYKNKYLKAVELYEKAYQSDASYKDKSYKEIGKCYERLAFINEKENNFEKADKYYQLALKHDKNKDYYLSYAAFLESNNKYTEAYINYKKCLESGGDKNFIEPKIKNLETKVDSEKLSTAAIENEVNFCPKCRTKIIPEQNFCSKCGYDLTEYKLKMNIQKKSNALQKSSGSKKKKYAFGFFGSFLMEREMFVTNPFDHAFGFGGGIIIKGNVDDTQGWDLTFGYYRSSLEAYLVRGDWWSGYSVEKVDVGYQGMKVDYSITWRTRSSTSLFFGLGFGLWLGNAFVGSSSSDMYFGYGLILSTGLNFDLGKAILTIPQIKYDLVTFTYSAGDETYRSFLGSLIFSGCVSFKI